MANAQIPSGEAGPSRSHHMEIIDLTAGGHEDGEWVDSDASLECVAGNSSRCTVSPSRRAGKRRRTKRRHNAEVPSLPTRSKMFALSPPTSLDVLRLENGVSQPTVFANNNVSLVLSASYLNTTRYCIRTF